jgi:hypothetical protein
MTKKSDELYSPEETEQRVKKALIGAFRAPMPLKAVPGKPRASRVKPASGKPRKSA